MKKKILALVLALTMCFGTTMNANAAVNINNKMGATDTHNILDKNSSKIPKGTLQYLASKFKIEYTQQDLDALKKIFDANLYAKAYPDVAAAYGNDREALWNHYVTHGIKEGRTQISTFNVFAYIAAYPDLRNAFGDDLVAYYVHYANYGINENRKLTTIDAATKAGITVTGLQGQVIARPIPIQVPDLSSYSVPSSVPKADNVNDTPKVTTQPTETPKPSETPSPSVTPTPTPTPTPEELSEPTSCDHSYTVFEAIESQAHFHYAKCKECGEYATREDGSKLPLECKYEDFVCRDCNRPCNHDNFDGMKQIDGTSTHGPLCKICGYVDTENTEACEADHCESVDDSYHNEICKACGGVIKAEPHQYSYTSELTDDGVPIHKATCATCGNEIKRSCEFNFGSDTCNICGLKHEEHVWVHWTGDCVYCGITCDHPSKDNNGTCTACGYNPKPAEVE